MKIKKILTVLAAAMVIFGLSYFCKTQTKGFRTYFILSNLPNEPRWEAPPLSQAEQSHIDSLLDQPFTYLGSGGWCYAFLGEDQKTVLKFFKHEHFFLSTILRNFSFNKLLMQSSPWPKETPYFQEFNFKSCTLLYKEAKERTGLLYLHLNKTKGLHKPVRLIDNIGVRHTIDLDKTEFVVQKRAELLFDHINRLAKEQKIETAKHSLDDMIDCLLTLFKRGARDLDLSLHNNFGYTEDGAITLDLSSFELDESLKSPGNYRKELIVKTRWLSRFLNKNHPDLYTHFENRLSEIVEKG